MEHVKIDIHGIVQGVGFRPFMHRLVNEYGLSGTICNSSSGVVLELEGIDEVLIGLNDLHLQYQLKFMFELLSNGKVDELIGKLKAKGKFCGFGGIARLNEGMISGRNILTEHYRLKSNMAILSRSFCDTSKIKDMEKIDRIFHEGVKEIREYEEFLSKQSKAFFKKNHEEVIQKVNEIVGRL